ncbi:amidohydrolase family protein [Nocardia sp. NPDC088792]|uniref:amidohydrolase family protein n=1 Tax=Nocardia sp. NPDC088792 TaxID=3364332 RepID=UPI003817776D
MKIIGLEEHLVTESILDTWRAGAESAPDDPALQFALRGPSPSGLLDLGDERLKAMDEVGMDVQVLSLTTPGLQRLTPAAAVPLQTEVNDVIAAAVRAHPDRLQGFATLATPAPAAAAAELGRAVTELGLCGAMVFGRTGDQHFDHPDYWPIFEAAEALRAPLYIHPQTPPAGVLNAYYSGFDEVVDAVFGGPGIGWHYDVGIEITRMIIGGVFDRFPDLQVIVGHWGEVALFYLDRIDLLQRVVNLPRPVSDYWRTNVSVTPSGMFTQRYLRWAIEVLGIDRIMFSADYPFVPVPENGCRNFLEQADLTDAEREQIGSGNWERLCANIRR